MQNEPDYQNDYHRERSHRKKKHREHKEKELISDYRSGHNSYDNDRINNHDELDFRERQLSQDFSDADNPERLRLADVDYPPFDDFENVYNDEHLTRSTRHEHKSKKKSSKHRRETVENAAVYNENPELYLDDDKYFNEEDDEKYRRHRASSYDRSQRESDSIVEGSMLSGSINYGKSTRPLPSSNVSVPNGTRRYSNQPIVSLDGNNFHPPSSYSGYDEEPRRDNVVGGFENDEQRFWNPDVEHGSPHTLPEQPSIERSPRNKMVSKLLSSFRRFKPKGNSGLHQPNPNLSEPSIPARVILLDGEEATFPINHDSIGQVLFDHVCRHVDLFETDYFGLTYVSNKLRTWFWLDLQTKINKQLKENEQWLFYFQVKFYPPEPSMLQEDLTRYQLTLQIRQDIYTGKLPCSWVTQALLGSFMVQAELGDYDSEQHIGLEYLKDFEFVPTPTPQLLQKITELHKTHIGMKPNQADLKYLETAKRLELYGVDLHPARDMENVEIYIGVGFHGVLIYRDRLRIGRFAWPKVLRISYKKNNFYLKIRPDYSEPVEAIVGFRLMNPHLADRLWKTAVEHHAFFRLKETPQAKRTTPTIGLLKSHFRFTGRTFFQYRTMNIDRPHPNFNRSIMKRRTASMPTGLNAAQSLHTLNRSHPRDMTVGRTQDIDQPKRTGSLHMPYSSLTNGDPVAQLYGTVPRNSQLSGSLLSGSQAMHSKASRQISGGANSLSRGSAVTQSEEYINMRNRARQQPSEDGSNITGSSMSGYGSQRGHVVNKGRSRHNDHSPSEVSDVGSDKILSPPVYANIRAQQRRRDDESSTSTDKNIRSSRKVRESTSGATSRRPPTGGVPVFGGVMTPNHFLPEKNHNPLVNSNDRVNYRQYHQPPDLDDDDPATITDDIPNTQNYRSHNGNKSKMEQQHGTGSSRERHKNTSRSHRRQSGNVEGML